MLKLLRNCLRNFKKSRFQLDLGFKQHKVFLIYLSRKERTARVHHSGCLTERMAKLEN